MRRIGAAAEAVNDDIIALAGMVDRVVPGDVDLLLGVFADLTQECAVLIDLFEQRGHGGGVFLDEEAVAAVGDILGGTAPGDQDAGEAAGRGLPDDQPVRIEGGGEEKEVGAAVPRADHVTVIGGRDEKDLVVQQKLVTVGFDLGAVGALADKNHAEIAAAVLQRLHRVENDAQALVPHDAPDEQEHRHTLRQVETRADGMGFFRLDPSGGKVHAVGHDDIIARIAERTQIFARAAADRPDLVAGGDVLHQRADRGLL